MENNVKLAGLYMTRSSLQSDLSLRKPSDVIKDFKKYSGSDILYHFTNSFSVHSEMVFKKQAFGLNIETIMSEHEQIKSLKFDRSNFEKFLIDFHHIINDMVDKHDITHLLLLEDDVFIQKPINYSAFSDSSIFGDWSDYDILLADDFAHFCGDDNVGGQGGTVLNARFFHESMGKTDKYLSFLKHFFDIGSQVCSHYSTDVFFSCLVHHFGGKIIPWDSYTMDYSAAINPKNSIEVFHDWSKESREHR